MDSEWKTYIEIAQNLYPQFTPDDGISLEEIEQAEKVYGFLLPKMLREFYLLVGNHEAINASHNRLLSVDCLEIEDRKLVFYEENQGVCYWAIDLDDIAKDNPQVWAGQSVAGQENLEWHLDAENLFDFLLIMLCWQSVMGGLPFIGIADKLEESISQIVRNHFSLLEIGMNFSGLQVFIDQGKVICLAESEKGTSIYAGASDKENFLAIGDILQIDWDYNSLDD